MGLIHRLFIKNVTPYKSHDDLVLYEIVRKQCHIFRIPDDDIREFLLECEKQGFIRINFSECRKRIDSIKLSAIQEEWKIG